MEKHKKEIINLREVTIKNGEEDFSKYISEKVKEISKLKKDLEIKKDVFNFIKKNKKDEIKNIFNERGDIYSYFLKFVDIRDSSNIYLVREWGGDIKIGDFKFFENDFWEDIDRLENNIQEKELRFEKRLDLRDSREDRKKQNNFTWVLAFGVLVSLFFNLSQLFIDFSYAETSRVQYVLGIFLLIFVVLMGILSDNFENKEENEKYLSKNKITVFVIVFLLLFLMYFAIFYENKEINRDTSLLDSINNIGEIIRNESLNKSIIVNSPIYLNEELFENNTRVILLNPKT